MNYQYQFSVKLCTLLCSKRYKALGLALDYRERNGLHSYNAQIVQTLIHKVQEWAATVSTQFIGKTPIVLMVVPILRTFIVSSTWQTLLVFNFTIDSSLKDNGFYMTDNNWNLEIEPFLRITMLEWIPKVETKVSLTPKTEL